MGNISNKPPMEISADVRILIGYIETKMLKEKQDVISYHELGQLIGRNVQHNKNRGLLATARKRVEKTNNIIIKTVYKVGIKRSDDLVGVLYDTRTCFRRRIRKQTKRVLNALNDGTERSPDTMVELNAEFSLLGAIGLFSKASAQKKLIETIHDRKTTGELPTIDTLKLFTNGK